MAKAEGMQHNAAATTRSAAATMNSAALTTSPAARKPANQAAKSASQGTGSRGATQLQRYQRALSSYRMAQQNFDSADEALNQKRSEKGYTRDELKELTPEQQLALPPDLIDAGSVFDEAFVKFVLAQKELSKKLKGLIPLLTSDEQKKAQGFLNSLKLQIKKFQRADDF